MRNRGLLSVAMTASVMLIAAMAALVMASVVQMPSAVAVEHDVTVEVGDFFYDPATVEVDPGDTVQWVVSDEAAEEHTITSVAEPPLFNSGTRSPGSTYELTFDHPGTYAYFCQIHPGEMDGTVVVSGQAAPLAPSDVAATAGDASATVTWSPPASDGGSPITGYTVTAEPGGATAQVDGDATSATVPGLTNGTAYTFTVTATNAEGTSPASEPSVAVTPTESTPDPCPEAPFTDREDIPSTHRFNVDCAAELGIVAGFGDDTYGPTAQVRRDQMASFIARSLDAAGVELPAPTGERFDDVAAGSAHDEAIHRLAAADIVQGGAGGLPESSYAPGLGVRRDQMASFLLRAAAYAVGQDLASDTQHFPDVGPTNAHFGNVNGAFETGLAAGFEGGNYGPAAGVRRDQMGTFVMRLFHYVDADAG